MFDKKQKKKLLEIARKTIKQKLSSNEDFSPKEVDKELQKEYGAFVTFHKKGSLRGCIGNMMAKGPLYLTIKEMTLASALHDPRFAPMKKEELHDVDIEISVLSHLEKITDPELIEMGKHGVLVKKGLQSGVYLPQVARETGWSREEFMNSLCLHKAGIPEDSWKTGECEIYIFTAEVFGEKDK